MVQITEAIFDNGKFTPTGPVELSGRRLVRLTIEDIAADTGGTGVDRPTIYPPTCSDCDEARRRLTESFERLSFRSAGSYPKREELYDRHDAR